MNNYSDITKVNIPDNMDDLIVGNKPPYFPYPDLSGHDKYYKDFVKKTNDDAWNILLTQCSGLYNFPVSDENYQESIYVQEGKMWVTDVKSSG